MPDAPLSQAHGAGSDRESKTTPLVSQAGRALLLELERLMTDDASASGSAESKLPSLRSPPSPSSSPSPQPWEAAVCRGLEEYCTLTRPQVRGYEHNTGQPALDFFVVQYQAVGPMSEAQTARVRRLVGEERFRALYWLRDRLLKEPYHRWTDDDLLSQLAAFLPVPLHFTESEGQRLWQTCQADRLRDTVEALLRIDRLQGGKWYCL